MSDQGWFESDEDYRQRIAQEADERSIEESTGSTPSQSWFENDDEYRSRIAEEANEARIEQSTGSTPSQGWFEGADDYRERIATEANEAVIEGATGSAPSRGWFESDEAYEVRVRMEANEHVVSEAGDTPRQGWFEGNHEYRSRIAHEARETRAKGSATRHEVEDPSHPYSGSSTTHSLGDVSSGTGDTRSGMNVAGVALAALVVIALFVGFEKSRSDQSIPPTSVPANEAPEFLVDRERCPFEGCRYSFRLLAEAKVDGYSAPPDRPGTARANLQRVITLRAGEWVIAETGVLLSRRRDAYLNSRSSYGNGSSGPSLQRGMKVEVYGSLGEGCVRAYMNGTFPVICDVETVSGNEESEWWVRIRTADGGQAWLNTGDPLISQERLNYNLAEAISQAAGSTAIDLSSVDVLIKKGADLNGDVPLSTDPAWAAIETGNTDLLEALIARGFDVRSTKRCIAWIATQTATRTNIKVLELLLAHGMPLDCMPTPPLEVVLRMDIASRDYSIERAVEAASVLLRSGADLNQRNAQGESLFEALGKNIPPNLIAPEEVVSRLDTLRQAVERVAESLQNRLPAEQPLEIDAEPK